ncbi:unnamed protein product, partial [Cuscuta europaea]
MVWKEGKKLKEKRVGPPVDEDWEQAVSFTHFLKKFYDTTLVLSASKCSTSSLILKEMFAVERAIFYKKKDASNPTLQKVAISMSTKFVKYWGCFGSVNKLIYVANVLDPRFKLQLLRKQHTIIETK